MLVDMCVYMLVILSNNIYIYVVNTTVLCSQYVCCLCDTQDKVLSMMSLKN